MSQDSRASVARYHPVAKALHWLVALLVAVQFGIAWAMPDIGPHTKLGRLISLHLTVGALIGLATFARVSWRVRHTAPGDIATEPRWLRAGARVSHATLYVLLLIVPLLGWAAASARGWRVTLFPRLALPALLPRGSRSGFLAGDVHTFLAYTLLAIVALHIAAALYHRFILHDQVLARMLPDTAEPSVGPRGTRGRRNR
ncbi:MAG: cytochrome b [Steroidobacteraceae bacterium]